MIWHLKHAQHGDRPWDVQGAALRRSAGRPRYGFHLEQGLGKSSLTLNEFVASDADIMVVVAPQSFKGDWPLLPDEWGVPEIASGMWPRDPFPVNQEKMVYAINYEAVRTSAGRLLADLIKRRRVFLVLDETTSIKNPQSQTSKAVMSLAKDTYMVRVLNGTPLVSNCMDLFAPLKCLGELDRTNPFAFKNRYAVLGGYMGKQIKGMKNEAELYSILDRVAFRALKQDWRDLPPKVYTTVHLEMTRKQRKAYDDMMEDFFAQVDGIDVSADMVLTQLGRLQQISSCLAIQEGKSNHFEDLNTNPKIKATLDIIDSGPNKTIVVHFFRATGDLLMEALTKAGRRPARIQGGMKPEEIRFEKDRFNNDPECRELVGQESATARGHTLVGGTGNDRCSRMVFVENSFSLMERLQIEDRIHRGDQDQTCQYFDLITSPIDQKVLDVLLKKRAMADAVDEIVAVVREHKRK